MKGRKGFLTIVLAMLLAIGFYDATTLKAQDKDAPHVEKVLVGQYVLATDHLTEYLIQGKNGVVMQTINRSGSSMELGKADKEAQKQYMQYVNANDYSLFTLKYKQSRDYFYVRIYLSDGDYYEAYWNDNAVAEVHKFYTETMAYVELAKGSLAAKK